MADHENDLLLLEFDEMGRQQSTQTSQSSCYLTLSATSHSILVSSLSAANEILGGVDQNVIGDVVNRGENWPFERIYRSIQ
jgi:hypothetical protein